MHPPNESSTMLRRVPKRARFNTDVGEIQMNSTAVFSECRQYRYVLRRTWNADQPLVMFIGLNPSTADEFRDDPTVRRCIGFAKSWGYGGLVLTNLFGFRSTHPACLREASDPVGPDNDRWIEHWQFRVDRVVAAWGVHGDLHDRHREVLSRIDSAFCLGLTNHGFPRHPLYLASVTPLVPVPSGIRRRAA